MRQVKLMDAGISVILFVFLFIWCLLRPDLENVIVSYFIIGGWQLISMIIHELNQWFTSRTSVRRIYHWISLFSLIAMPFGFAWVLLVTAPFMAAFYIYLCYREVYVKMRRPLTLLK